MKAVSAALGLSSLAGRVVAWGAVGHEAVGYVAQAVRELDSNAQPVWMEEGCMFADILHLVPRAQRTRLRSNFPRVEV